MKKHRFHKDLDPYLTPTDHVRYQGWVSQYAEESSKKIFCFSFFLNHYNLTESYYVIIEFRYFFLEIFFTVISNTLFFNFFLTLINILSKYHFQHIDTPNFQGLNVEYTYNTTFNQQLHQLHKMSDAIQPDSLVASQADNSKTATDIIAHKIAETCSVLTEPNQKRKVVDVVRAALVNFGLEEEQIEQILQQFNPNMTVQQYRSTYINSHLIQAISLVDAMIFEGFKNEAYLPINRNKKFHTMELTPHLVVLMIKKYCAMLDDSVRDRYLDNVRIFHEKIGRHLMLPFEPELYKSLGHDGCRTLRAIQKTCSFLAAEVLEAEKKPKHMPLEEYSKRPVFKSFKVSNKNLAKVVKVLESSKETVDLVKNSESFEINFNCFKCISAIPNFKPMGSQDNPIRPDSPTSDLQLRPPLRFIDATKAAFNVYKALPLSSRREAEEHLTAVHSVTDPRRLAGASSTCGGHPSLLFCDLCASTSSKIVFAATCCLTHRLMHFFFLLVQLFRSYCPCPHFVSDITPR